MKRSILLLIVLISLATTANAQWVKTNGPDSSGIVSSIVINGTKIFAGTFGEGAFLSNDGVNWGSIDNGLTDSSLYSLALSNGTLIAGTSHSGIFVSTNNGTSWTPSNSGLSATFIYTLTVNNGIIYAGTDQGMFISANNGTSWTAANAGALYDVYAIAIKDSNIFEGTYSNQIFLSTNNGASWTSAGNGLPNASINAMAIIDSNIFAGTNGLGVYRSTNNGAMWLLKSNGLPTGAFIWTFAVSGHYIFAGTLGNGVYISSNYGENWVPVNTGLNGSDLAIYSLAIFDNTIYAGTYNGYVWKRSLSEIITSGIDETIINKEIGIYPNPAKENLTIVNKSTTNQSYTVTIRTIQGQEVLSKDIKLLNTYSMDVTNIANGIYILTLQNENTQIVEKVIVQH